MDMPTDLVKPPVAERQAQRRAEQLRALRIVSYNVHWCRGLDRRIRPDRIARVLRELDADIIGLQEVLSFQSRSPRDDQARYLAEQLAYQHYFVGGNRERGGGTFGNVIFSRLPILNARNHDISCGTFERRGCLRADIEISDGRLLHVFNLHLGLRAGERHQQARMLLGKQILRREDVTGARIVLGDFNEWRRGAATRLLSQEFQAVNMRRMLLRGGFPALLPILHLDNIYYDPPLRMQNFRIHRSRTALIASDHLPVVVEFALGGPELGTDLK
jgi:endonuclease/exonuclease/phosphatase family metal-dependent hydrolase